MSEVIQIPPVRRRPKNEAEAKFFDYATENGFDVCKRGWPDFIIEKNERIMCVEVKREGQRLKEDQERVMRRLAAYGVPCYRWSPEEGFKRINP